MKKQTILREIIQLIKKSFQALIFVMAHQLTKCEIDYDDFMKCSSQLR